MRLLLLLLASMLVAGPAAAQEGKPSSAPSAEDAKPSGPVSLERIREGLSAGAVQADAQRPREAARFQGRSAGAAHLEEILATLDFKTGPVPAGGLYMYEQQRQLSNPVDRPLAQPYAAFSPGELITIAVENLMFKYLGGRLADAVTSAERERAETDARREVAGAIEKYCAADPERASACHICTRLKL